ncbi:MAG: flagellin, partial [Verrucomicrobia bacterium]|nr:flagellin [Verrucomicrobiota bacterium]
GKALDRMSELATLAQDPTKANELGNYQKEFAELQSYLSDVATKNFNGVSLFAGTAMSVTVDSEVDGSNGKHSITGVSMGSSTAYGTVYATGGSALQVDTAAHAQSALTSIKSAISLLAGDRAQIGANISVLNSYGEQMGVLQDNLGAANSRIKDVDVAEESTLFARNNILVQAGTAMLAQANASSQSALRLLA